MPTIRAKSLAAVLLWIAPFCLADAKVEQKTQVRFGGALGGVINVFGGKATREGITSTTVVKGNRKLTNSGASSEIVDLSEEKIYQIDNERKTYKVVTFEELRKQLEEARKRAEASEKTGKNEKKDSKKNEGPEYEVDFDVKETGKKQAINGFDTRQVVFTVTVREKGKKLEQSGGWVLTSDMWMGPRIAAMREIADFDRRYYQKLYGSLFSGAEMQQMAMLMASTPAFAKAMKVLGEKKSNLDGTPIRSITTFETVTGSEQPKEARNDERENEPASASAAVIGGLLNRMKKRQSSDSASEAPPPAANRSRIFDGTTELLKASASASTADVAIPAGFKLKS